MKPKHQRLLFISFSLTFLCAGVLLVMNAFQDNLVFFYSPSDIREKSSIISTDKTIRVGGIVKVGSLEKIDDRVTFIITDGKEDVSVTYKGVLPNLFREGQGCIAEGKMLDTENGEQTIDKMFVASRILAKHDEQYMPKEVVDALKKSGQWKGE
ncbi:MAG: cytochrome c maturation protein CcmE [Rickettsiales bacterium]